MAGLKRLVRAAVLSVVLSAIAVGCGSPDDGPEDAAEPSVTTATTVPAPSASTTTNNDTETTVDDASDAPAATFPAYGDAPPFTGIVEYVEHDPALGDPGTQVTVVVRHSAPLLFEVEVVAESGGRSVVGKPETVFFGDGSETWVDHPDDPAPLRQDGLQHFWHLFYGSVLAENSGTPGWREICGDTPTVVGADVIAGRQSTHLSCSTDLEDYELWVDERSGVVLRMMGPLQFPVLARDGSFTFTEINYGPIELEVRATPEPDPRAYPPFHLVREFTQGGQAFTVEFWYRDEGTLRREITDATDPEAIGTYNVVAGGNTGGCETSAGHCEWAPYPEITDVFFVQLIGQLGIGERTMRCTELDETTLLGRATRHFVCGGEAVSHDLWYDAATGLLLRERGPFGSLETTVFEVDPVFPEGIFEYEEITPPPPDDTLRVGDTAPLWSGPLVGGGSFDLAEQRGSPVVVFNWFPTCGDGCFDGLGLIQELYETYGDSVVFVTVSEEIESETARALERRNNTVPAVYCVVGTGGPDVDPGCATPQPGVDPWLASPWYLWGNPIPSTTVLDGNGTAVAVYTEFIEYGEELDSLLAELSGVIQTTP